MLTLAKTFVFDNPEAVRFVEARQKTMLPVLTELRERMGIKFVADVGCGVGYFSEFLADLGFDVTGFDGRLENVDEARRRHPNTTFDHANVEDESILRRGSFDLVLCVGLLYHLENPLRAVRNLSELARQALLIESFIVPNRGTIFHLREEPVLEDQGLRYISLFPSESSIVKACYTSGFARVYRFKPLPDHEYFRDLPNRRRQRTMLLAARTDLEHSRLEIVAEPKAGHDPWETTLGRIQRYWVLGKSVVAKTAAGKLFRSAKRGARRTP